MLSGKERRKGRFHHLESVAFEIIVTKYFLSCGDHLLSKQRDLKKRVNNFCYYLWGSKEKVSGLEISMEFPGRFL